MKVRFYRGPMNGKIREARDDQQYIDTVNRPKLDYNNLSNWANVPVEHHLYVRTQHTHPDGSVFFEWTKPKGSRR